MALMQELTNQGRVVAGHLTNGIVLAGRHGLVVQLLVVRQKFTSETVSGWEEIIPERGFFGRAGTAAIGSLLPGSLGKTVGATVGAAAKSGHTVRVDWASGKKSVIELPNKLFGVLLTMMKELQVVSPEPQSPKEATNPTIADRILDGASSFVSQYLPGPVEVSPEPSEVTLEGADDVVGKLRQLAQLRDAGLITEAEFDSKRSELLKRL